MLNNDYALHVLTIGINVIHTQFVLVNTLYRKY